MMQNNTAERFIIMLCRTVNYSVQYDNILFTSVKKLKEFMAHKLDECEVSYLISGSDKETLGCMSSGLETMTPIPSPFPSPSPSPS